MKDKYTLGKCKICKIIKALKNDKCIDCNKLLKTKDIFPRIFDLFKKVDKNEKN